MEDLDDPQLQRKIAEIRQTLQKMGTSFTEDDTSEFGKSAFSSEDSFDKKFQFHSPQVFKYTEREKSKFEGRKIFDGNSGKAKETEDFKQPKQVFKPFEEGSKGKLMEKDVEIKTLKDINDELRREINNLTDLLQKREKELNKIIFEKEIHVKAEEEIRKSFEELKKELKSAKSYQDKLEGDKKDLVKSLSEQKLSFDRLQKAYTQKTEELLSIRNSKESDFESPKSLGLAFDPKKFDFQRLRIPEKLTPSSPDHAEHFTDRQEHSFKVTCHEAMKIVGVSEFKDFYPRLLHLRQYHSKYKKAKQIVERISDMMIQCSPEGTFKEQPSTRQIWRWITRLLEEYMRIKQTISGDLLYKLCGVLEVQHLEDILEKVVALTRLKRNN